MTAVGDAEFSFEDEYQEFSHADLDHLELFDANLAAQQKLAELQAKLAAKGMTVSADPVWNTPLTVACPDLAPMMAGITSAAHSATEIMKKMAAAFDVPVEALCTAAQAAQAATAKVTFPENEPVTMQGPDGVLQHWNGSQWVVAVDPAPPKIAHTAQEAVTDLAVNGEAFVQGYTDDHGTFHLTQPITWSEPDSSPVEDVQKAMQAMKDKTFTVDLHPAPMSPEMVKLLYGFDPAEDPIHQSLPEMPVSTAKVVFSPLVWAETGEPDYDEEDVPALFADDPDPDDGIDSSGNWCMACNTHWNDHPGDPVACYSAGYVRPALPHEEKAWRARQKAKEAATDGWT
jgi:hypothetical protein